MKHIHTLLLILTTTFLSAQCCPCSSGTTTDPEIECCYNIGANASTPGYINLTSGLTCDGTNIANFIISWQDADGVEIFQSGGGLVYVPSDMYAHPTTGIPSPSGDIYPVLVSAFPILVDNPADCMDPITVQPINCVDGYNITYNASGGLQAMITQDIQIEPGTDNVYLCFDTDVVPDQVTVDYNGSEIYNSGFVSTGFSETCANVNINYVNGVDLITLSVENESPDASTIYSASVECCDEIDCTTVTLPDLVVTSTRYNDCACSMSLASGGRELSTLCGLQSSGSTGTTFVDFDGGCDDDASSLTTGCDDNPINITYNAVNDITLDFATSTEYVIIRDNLQANAANNNYEIILQLRDVDCASDGFSTNFYFFPNHDTYTFDDVNFTIRMVMDPVNPYPEEEDCGVCLHELHSPYDSMLSSTDESTDKFIVQWQSIRRIFEATAVEEAVEPEALFNDYILTDECGRIERDYKFTYQDVGCPCESWQMYEDTNGDGVYDVLISEAVWSGTCP